ncbi:MAG: flagellar basal body P-ring formation chaperone FlgA [Pseudomonadota bacterium]
MLDNTQKPTTSLKGIGYTIALAMICMGISFTLLILDSATAKAESPVSLQTETYLSDKVITVGDVFKNAGPHTNHVLAPAPEVGETMVLGLYDLQRIAQAFDLDWTPDSRHQEVVLQRAVSEVEKSEVALLIEEALKNKTGTENIEIDLETVLPRLTVNGLEKPVLSAEAVKFNAADETFEVTVHINGTEDSTESITVKGRVHRLIDIPVLNENLRKGDIIREHHIEYSKMRAAELAQSYVLDSKDAVGMTPRRSIISDRPIRINDLEKPRLVNKGDMITMILKNGALSLTAKGKAMDSGARGEVIRVMNTTSRRIIEAKIKSPQQVTIATN